MATVTRYFCLHLTSVLLSRYVCSYTLFFSKNVVFPAQAEYSYFSADFRLKIFLYYYLNIIVNDISVLEVLGYQLQVFGIWICIALHCACALPLFVRSEAKMSRQTTLGRFGFEKSIRTELARWKRQ